MAYYLKIDDRELLKKLRLTHVCAECGAELWECFDMEKHLPYLECRNNPEHEGIAKPYREPPELNIPTRREQLEKEHGNTTATALAKYQGVSSLTKPQAMEILRTVYPDAPDNEIVTTAILCASYGLNPLMNHVFLIPFTERKTGKKTWARVIGIKANRLIASRKGSFSYVDDTPRLMTEEEQEKRFGETYPDMIVAIVKLRDPSNGAEAVGYGMWPKSENPYGTEKGNTKFNMAAIRAERQALDRLRPGEMPTGVEVADEQFLNGQFQVASET